MPILFPSITLGYSGVVSFHQLYIFLLSHHDMVINFEACLFFSTDFHLLVIIFGLTIYDRLCYLFSFARPWSFLLFHSTVVPLFPAAGQLLYFHVP